MRIYEPRLGKFLSVDPLYNQYPDLSSYQFASNSPIENIDLDGLEKYSVHLRTVNGQDQIFMVETDNSLKYKSTPNIESVPTLKPKVVEFIHEDNQGKVWKRTGEIPLKNFGSTLYAGPWNPKYTEKDAAGLKGLDRYDYPSINMLDKAAKNHDQAYDLVQSIGFKGAIFDVKTLTADKKLVRDASMVVGMYYLGVTDPVNNLPISVETKDAALKVVGIFSAIVAEKAARLGGSKAVNYIEKKTKSFWDMMKSAVKEGERRITPTP